MYCVKPIYWSEGIDHNFILLEKRHWALISTSSNSCSHLVWMCLHAASSSCSSASNVPMNSSSEPTVVCFQATSGTGTLGRTRPTAGGTRTTSSSRTDTQICDPLWKEIQTLENSRYRAYSPSGISPAKKTIVRFTFCSHELLYNEWVLANLDAEGKEGYFCSISNSVFIIFIQKVKQCHYLWATIMQSFTKWFNRGFHQLLVNPVLSKYEIV